MSVKLSLIVAGCETETENILGIGYKDVIPWNLSKDLIHFKNTTTGHFVLMGLNTWLSIGKPLPNRLNIIVTSKHEQYNKTKYDLYDTPLTGFYNIHGFSHEQKLYNYVMFVESIESGIALYEKMHKEKQYELADLFIIGGGKIYQQIIEKYSDQIEKIFLTKIDKKYTCDTFIDMSILQKKKCKKIFEANLTDVNEIKFAILIYLL